MKKIVMIIFSFGLIGSCIDLVAQDIIEAYKVDSVVKIKPSSRVWMLAKSTNITLYPKKIDQNSADLNASNKEYSAKKANVRALYDEQNIVFLLEWLDDTKNIKQENNVSLSGDGFSIQFVTDKKISALPYIDMGNSGRRTIIYEQKVVSDKNSSNSQRVIIGEGKKSINEIKREDLNSSAKIEYISGGWRALLLHPLKDKYMDINTSTAVSFSVWDGYKKDKNSTKFFSSWVGVGLDASKDDPFLASLSIKLKADASKGKELFKNFCASCHRTKYFQSAPINKAPNLSNVGGFSTVSYLLESIVNPDAIVVCDQKNRDKINYFWYTISENGERKSIMPSFSNLESKSLTNLVAYLKTLKIDTRK